MSQTLRFDLLDRLTVTELDMASRMLKEDIVTAVVSGTAGRWKGLALLAYMVAKHTDPTVKLKSFMDLGSAELVAELNRLAGADTVLDELEEAEAELERLTRAAEGVDDELELVRAPEKKVEDTTSSVSAHESSAEAAANPTVPASASSSPARGALTPAGSPA